MLDNKSLTLIQKHISIVTFTKYNQTGLVSGTLDRKLRISQTHIFGPYGLWSLAGESSIKDKTIPQIFLNSFDINRGGN